MTLATCACVRACVFANRIILLGVRQDARGRVRARARTLTQRRETNLKQNELDRTEPPGPTLTAGRHNYVRSALCGRRRRRCRHLRARI